MSSFKCGVCGCQENTALCNGQVQMFEDVDVLKCSECNPEIGRWHNRFKKMPFDGPHDLNKHGPLPTKYRHK